MNTLRDVARQLATPGKGILAIDESQATCRRRFDALGVSCTEETRQAYRELLITAPDIEHSLSGMILFDETMHQSTRDGVPFLQVLLRRGILPGIKVDEGTVEDGRFPGEYVTRGLDDLAQRLRSYKAMGAAFAKWRAVFVIDERKMLPTDACIRENAQRLASYAAICQQEGIVPMVEPEILMDGTHSVTMCQSVSARVWKTLFVALSDARVDVASTILKTSMVLSGKDAPSQADDTTIAHLTIDTLEKNIPRTIAGVVFLSGGQTDRQSTVRLNLMHQLYRTLPWPLSFSYGRGIQQPALELWAQDPEKNYAAAQKIIAHRAAMNGLAALGMYDPSRDSRVS